MKSTKAKTKISKLKKRSAAQCEYPATAVAMLDFLPVLTGKFALDNALKEAIAANVVDEWLERFDDLRPTEAMKVLAHVVLLSYGGKPHRVASAESIDSIG